MPKPKIKISRTPDLANVNQAFAGYTLPDIEDDNTLDVKVITPVDPATGRQQLPVILYDATLGYVGGTAYQGAISQITLSAAPIPGLFVNSQNLDYDQSGNVFRPSKTGEVLATVNGATPQNLIVGAGAGLKRRLFNLVVGASTAGLITVADGANIALFYAAANTNTVFTFGKDGVKQPTANGTITLTAGGGGNIAGTLVCDAGST